jgi:Asp-tRNA(Asn)/Glu-tRNA(Gln) amidotransferase A subunit family amidase
MPATLHQASLVTLARKLAAGETTSEAVTRACLDRIAAREPVVQAWAYLDPDHALAQARARDREPRRSPLHGIPLGIKDVFETADMPTEYGSAVYKGYRPPRDAGSVALLRQAGCVLVGKTVTTEFAAGFPSKTRNPHNPAHTPGGSSAGSAAAVADGMIPAATGSQTMGSVIRPAAFCGAVGFKPTYGLIPVSGAQEEAPSADTVGLFAREIGDLAPLMDVLVRGTAWRVALDRAPRLAVMRGPAWQHAQPEAIRMLDDVAERMRKAGAAVSDLAPAPEMEAMQAAMRTVLFYESPRMWSYEVAEKADGLSPWLRDFARGARAVTADQYISALKAGERGRAWLADRFAGIDAILTAAAPGEAPADLTTTGNVALNQAWTLAHGPCLTVPAARGPSGLPVGLQIVGARYEDARLLAVAQWVRERIAS